MHRRSMPFAPHSRPRSRRLHQHRLEQDLRTQPPISTSARSAAAPPLPKRPCCPADRHPRSPRHSRGPREDPARPHVPSEDGTRVRDPRRMPHPTALARLRPRRRLSHCRPPASLLASKHRLRSRERTRKPIETPSPCQQRPASNELCSDARLPSSSRNSVSARSVGANLLLIGGRRTATALRSVEHDGDACTLELVAQLRVATLRHELAGHSLEFERDSISVELLCIEQRGTGEERCADGGGGTGGEVVG